MTLHVFLPTKPAQHAREIVARGRSNNEIAAQLYLSRATVKTHVASIFKKLGLHDRA